LDGQYTGWVKKVSCCTLVDNFGKCGPISLSSPFSYTLYLTPFPFPSWSQAW